MENLVATWVIGGLVAGLLVWVTVRLIRNKKKSVCGCGCGCEDCTHEKGCGHCHEHEDSGKE